MGEILSSGFSTAGSLISASVVPHCGFSKKAKKVIWERIFIQGKTMYDFYLSIIAIDGQQTDKKLVLPRTVHL